MPDGWSPSCRSGCCPSRTEWRWAGAARTRLRALCFSSCCSSNRRGFLRRGYILEVKLAQPHRQEARVAVAHGLFVDPGYWQDEIGTGGEKGFPCLIGFFKREGPLLEIDACSPRRAKKGLAGDPIEDRVICLACHQLVVRGDDPGVGRGAFGYGSEIGRASCREREAVMWGGARRGE